MKNNIIDKFLQTYDSINQRNSRIETRRIIKKPKKFESILGFGLSLMVLIILLRHVALSPNGMFFVILIFDLLFLAYYGVNLFTKNGFGLPATIQVLKPEEPQDYNEPEQYNDYSNEDDYSDEDDSEDIADEENNNDDDDDDYDNYRRVQRY